MKLIKILVALFILAFIINVSCVFAQSTTFIDSMISINHNYNKLAIYSDYGTDFYAVIGSEKIYFSPSLFPLYKHHKGNNSTDDLAQKITFKIDSITTAKHEVKINHLPPTKIVIDTLIQVYAHYDSIQTDCSDCIEYTASKAKHNTITFINNTPVWYMHKDTIIYSNIKAVPQQKAPAVKLRGLDTRVEKVKRLKALLWKQNKLNNKLKGSSTLHEVTYSMCQHDFKIKPMLKVLLIGYVLDVTIKIRELALRHKILANKAKIKALQAEIKQSQLLVKN